MAPERPMTRDEIEEAARRGRITTEGGAMKDRTPELPLRVTVPEAKCKSCDATIIWAHVKKKDGTPGKMPFDPEPRDDGTHRMTMREEDGVAIVHAFWVAPKARPAVMAEGSNLRTSHFATCPNADDHRRKS
jgi:hypothetical protein